MDLMFDLVVGYIRKHCSPIYDWLNAKNKIRNKHRNRDGGTLGWRWDIEVVVCWDRDGGL